MWSMKMLSLILLVAQNAGLVTIMKYARSRRDRPMFLASTAVMSDEVLKLTLCFCVTFWSHWRIARSRARTVVTQGQDLESKCDDVPGVPQQLSHETFTSYMIRCVLTWDGVTLAVPALLYTVQKNLLYVAVSNLDACVYQVIYQAKIMTTALFSYLMLGTSLTRRKIFALWLLMAGVALVQISQNGGAEKPTGERPLLGLMAVAVACLTSGFASVFFEYKLKKKTSEPVSVWVKNMQLAFFAFLLAAFGVFTKDFKAVCDGGFFQGYDVVVLLTILLEAFGGIMVALVIKYADNIAKNFATGLSLTVTTCVSALFWDFQITTGFLVGSALTLWATYIYSSTPASSKPHANPSSSAAKAGESQ